MKKRNYWKLSLNVALVFGATAAQGAIVSKKVSVDLSSPHVSLEAFKNAEEEKVNLMAQPMVTPRPAKTETSLLHVSSVNDGKWIAFRLRWADKERSEAGKLGKFSDAVAIQFPVKDGAPPPIFMGAKGSPVHIFHWRAQYQQDRERGKPDMVDLYPNMNIDMYPMEFRDAGSVKGLDDSKRETYSHGKAAGNPQSYAKGPGIDEIFAEGFGSSSVIENVTAHAEGLWEKGEWVVVINRPLVRENGSSLAPGKDGFTGFAVWQGGKDEVGSRKSVTMAWVPLQVRGE